MPATRFWSSTIVSSEAIAFMPQPATKDLYASRDSPKFSGSSTPGWGWMSRWYISTREWKAVPMSALSSPPPRANAFSTSDFTLPLSSS